MTANKNSSAAALVGIWTILLSAFVITVLPCAPAGADGALHPCRGGAMLIYLVRRVLYAIPIALAVMITFLLSRLVSRLERWIGRIAAVLIVVAMLFGFIGGTGWLLTRQLIDLAAKLPDYQANIDSKLRSIRLPTGGAFSRFTHSVDELQKHLPNVTDAPAGSTDLVPATAPRGPAPGATPLPVRIVSAQSRVPAFLSAAAAGVLGPLGTAGLVLLLVIFMLLKREDLRGRMVRLIGQGRISATSRAMDDAGKRVARYLSMQFLVNVTFGACISLGLYFIGVPNAILWGAFAAIMRFIPYVGAWVAAAVPLLLSFAVSTSWLAPSLVLALFVSLELVNANILEPWLYGASTGVSSLALILAAVFWTWLWGPVGLLLSTPLTVCLAVMGRHVPKLQFLSVLLSEEQALAPHEEIYYRLLRLGLSEGSALAEEFVKTNSLTSLYDSVLLPVITMAEVDAQREQLDTEQRAAIHQHLHDIVEDFGTLPPTTTKPESDKTEAPTPAPAVSVLCVPARAYRDELGGAMLTQLLLQQGFRAENISAALSVNEVIELAGKRELEAICVSVVAPSTHIHARFVCAKLRAALPEAKIVVGIWGASENVISTSERLRASGADEVVVSLAQAVVQLSKYSVALTDGMVVAPIPPNDEDRVAQLEALQILDTLPENVFDRMTTKIARTFEVPIAMINFIDRDRQWIKSANHLPPELAETRTNPREQSICGHVVANDESLTVEDTARDRRFANNPLLIERGLRFYAGVPLRINGFAVGSLCLLDTKPRRLSEREQRLLEIMADDVVDEIKARASKPAVAAAA